MFRAQQNAFDDVVVKATDENLTSENWEYILDVCDKVAAEESGAKDAVAALIKRLAHRNANVQLYTLELANALSQNCGPKMHRELASRSFTDALLRLAADRNTHQQVKAKILERMAEWTEMFSRDPDLGIMEQAYMKLKTQNPNLRPPSKPMKTQITEVDRMKEEEELQMALALSVKENGVPQQQASGAGSASQRRSSSAAPAQQQQPSQPIQSGTTAATVSRVRALYDFQPTEPGELQFRKGDIIAVLESVYKDWWKGSLRGQTGIFPLNYVEKLQDPTPEELEREAQMEAEVFGQIKNVEKLLALLSTSSRGGDDVRDNEEITSLYHSTLAIRPKLIELIGKYSQKKDDFTQLNEKFIKARRDYEALLEASMAHPPQPAYGRPSYSYGAPPPQASYAGYPPSSPPPPQPQSFYGGQAPSETGHPPQHGPQPFYMIPPDARQSPKAAATPYPPQSIPLAQSRPQSTMYPPGPGGPPQELATGRLDSPVDNRTTVPHPDAQQPPYPPQSGPPPAVAAAGQPYDATTRRRQSSYDAYNAPPPGALASAPSAPSAPPMDSYDHTNPYQHRPSQPPGSPPPGSSPYIPYGGQPTGVAAAATAPPPAQPASGGGGGYQAYQPPPSQPGQQQHPQQRWPSGGSNAGRAAAAAAPSAADDGENFYR